MRDGHATATATATATTFRADRIKAQRKQDALRGAGRPKKAKKAKKTRRTREFSTRPHVPPGYAEDYELISSGVAIHFTFHDQSQVFGFFSSREHLQSLFLGHEAYQHFFESSYEEVEKSAWVSDKHPFAWASDPERSYYADLSIIFESEEDLQRQITEQQDAKNMSADVLIQRMERQTGRHIVKIHPHQATAFQEQLLSEKAFLTKVFAPDDQIPKILQDRVKCIETCERSIVECSNDATPLTIDTHVTQA